MTVPVFETFTVTNSGLSTSITVPGPAGLSENDIVLMIISLDGVNGSPQADADGFVTFAPASQGAVEHAFLIKRAGPSEPSTYTINWTGNERARVHVVRVSGCPTTGTALDQVDVNGAATTGTGVSSSVSAIVSTVIDTLAIAVATVDGNAVDISDGLSDAQGYVDKGTSGNNGPGGAGQMLASKDLPDIGNSLSPTFLWDNSQEFVTSQINLKGITAVTFVVITDESLEISEAELAVRELVRQVDESVEINEQINRLQSQVIQIDETVNITEVVLSVTGLIKQIDETLDMLENSTINNSQFIESIIGIGEDVITVTGKIKTLNETVNIDEAVLAVRNIVRQIDEDVDVQEDITLHNAKLVESLIEIEEAVIIVRNQIRIVNETINIDESVLRVKNLIIKIVDETVNILEQTEIVRDLVRIINEIINITEQENHILGLNRTVDESVNIIENKLAVRGLIRQVDEDIPIIENVTIFQFFLKFFIEFGSKIVRQLGFSGDGQKVGTYGFFSRIRKALDFVSRMKTDT